MPLRAILSFFAVVFAFSLFGGRVEAHSDVTFFRQRLFSGFDGKMCKVQPSIATDGNVVLMTWQNLLLTGSDVFYGELMARSTNNAVSFAPGVDQEMMKSTWNGKTRTAYYGCVFYSAKMKRWFGLGAGQCYVDDKKPILVSSEENPSTFPVVYDVDHARGVFVSKRKFSVPFKYSRTLPFGQILECDNGDMLVPFYVIPPNEKRSKSYSIIARCRFEGDEFKVLSAGSPIIDNKYPRGIGEPSLAKLGNKFFVTLRTDVQGLWASSDDGMNFTKPQPWRWDDGSLLENYNTQQHWIRFKGALYLAYTRKGAGNDHVFRHRAPIFMAKFDSEKGCLLRSTEIILVPELGARLGNFNVIEVSAKECWLITAEWMQSWDGKSDTCVRYGSDNSLWLVRIKLK